MKESSKQKVKKILLILLLFLLRILYLLWESWFSFLILWGIVDNDIREVLFFDTISTVLTLLYSVVPVLIMTVIEVKRIRKNQHKKGISRRIMVIESVLILTLPLFSYYYVPYVLDLLTILQYGKLY